MNKLREKFVDSLVILFIGFALLVAGALQVLLAPIFYILNYKSRKWTRTLLEEYEDFLNHNEGAEFFCYSNRKTSEKFVEQNILPKLQPAIHVIHLRGCIPQSSFDRKSIQYALIRKKGKLPVLMRIKNGKMLYASLHDELYETISGSLAVEDLCVQVKHKILQLRGGD